MKRLSLQAEFKQNTYTEKGVQLNYGYPSKGLSKIASKGVQNKNFKSIKDLKNP